MAFIWYTQGRQRFERSIEEALKITGEEIVRDIKDSQTLPRDKGFLTDATTVDHTDASKHVVTVKSSMPYARRLYYHPGYDFNRNKNKNAGGLWFEPYVNGKRRGWVINTFKRALGKRLK